MTTQTILIVVLAVMCVLALAVAWVSQSARSGSKQLDVVFAGREPLSDDLLYVRYFEALGVRPDIPGKVRGIFQQVLGEDFSRLHDVDDFSKELRFIWYGDSLADVQIVTKMEEVFGVAFTDQEAAQMRTLRDIVLMINSKIVQQSLPPVSGTRGTPAAYAPAAPGIPER